MKYENNKPSVDAETQRLRSMTNAQLAEELVRVLGNANPEPVLQVVIERLASTTNAAHG